MSLIFFRVYKNGNNQYQLLGVVSGGLYCGSRFPDFYTFTAHEEILPWIIKTANLSSISLSIDPISPDSRKFDQDSQCDLSSECLPISQCSSFLSQTERLKSFSRYSSEFNTLLSELRKLVCNKKLRKVCCKDEFDPALDKLGSTSSTTPSDSDNYIYLF